MTEQDKQLVHAARALGRSSPLVRDLVLLIDRLDKQLAEIKKAGEPLIEEMEAGLAMLPLKPYPGTIPMLQVTAEKGRRLAQALKEVKEVKDGKHLQEVVRLLKDLAKVAEKYLNGLK